MKVAIIFASQTGNTAQVALAVREGCSGHEIVAFGPPPADVGEAELVFAGSWTDRGTCAPEMRAFLHTLHGKNVVLFGTAGFGLSESYFASLLPGRPVQGGAAGGQPGGGRLVLPGEDAAGGTGAV